MNILEDIILRKRDEVAARKAQLPVQKLEQSIDLNRPVLSLKESLLNSPTGIIAEFKRKSPSKGIINAQAMPEQVAAAYASAGAAGISILTDIDFFGGSDDDVRRARPHVKVPVLRKEFIVDEYQLWEARAMGADAVLLIAAVLSPHQIKKLAQEAKTLGLDVLLEVHNLPELQRSLSDYVDIVGVNNRDLKTFGVSLEISHCLSEHIPARFVKISESGISLPEHLAELRSYGFQGFLIGENFMKTSDPGRSFKEFVQSLQLSK